MFEPRAKTYTSICLWSLSKYIRTRGEYTNVITCPVCPPRDPACSRITQWMIPVQWMNRYYKYVLATFFSSPDSCFDFVYLRGRGGLAIVRYITVQVLYVRVYTHYISLLTDILLSDMLLHDLICCIVIYFSWPILEYIAQRTLSYTA